MTLKSLLCATVLAASVLALPAQAATLNWARAADAQTLDPHAYNEGITHTLNHQMYEPLVARDDDGKLTPVLATSWKKLDSDPTVWEFKLRDGVTFHDGSPFTAKDVAFSIKRAQAKTSNVKALVSSIESVEIVDPHTVRFHTRGVNPILVNNLINIFMMSEKWADAHNVDTPQDFTSGKPSFASTHEDGTGPYELVSRVPDSRTVLKAYDGYWGKGQFPLDIDKVVYTPIQSSATRLSALLSGEVNFLQDVPPQDVERLKKSPNINVVTGPSNRSIFFGMNIGEKKLMNGDAKGNPFADVRVREAMNLAINRKVIQRVVMRGQSIPEGTIAPPSINGYSKELGALPPYDLKKAAALMQEAGYGDGFTVSLSCTNDAFLNDEAICRSLVAMLAKIKINVKLDVQPGAVQFPAIAQGKSDFYLLGWAVSTYDSEYMFDNLVHSRSNGMGAWSSINYHDADLDKKIESLATEPDTTKRNATIADIWKTVHDQVLYLPIHTQVLARAMAKNVHVTPNIGNQVFVKNITVDE